MTELRPSAIGFSDEDGVVRISGDHWGIPTPTLDALKNRSIPPDEATGFLGSEVNDGYRMGW